MRLTRVQELNVILIIMLVILAVVAIPVFIVRSNRNVNKSLKKNHKGIMHFVVMCIWIAFLIISIVLMFVANSAVAGLEDTYILNSLERELDFEGFDFTTLLDQFVRAVESYQELDKSEYVNYMGNYLEEIYSIYGVDLERYYSTPYNSIVTDTITLLGVYSVLPVALLIGISFLLGFLCVLPSHPSLYKLCAIILACLGGLLFYATYVHYSIFDGNRPLMTLSCSVARLVVILAPVLFGYHYAYRHENKKWIVLEVLATVYAGWLSNVRYCNYVFTVAITVLIIILLMYYAFRRKNFKEKKKYGILYCFAFFIEICITCFTIDSDFGFPETYYILWYNAILLSIAISCLIPFVQGLFDERKKRKALIK